MENWIEAARTELAELEGTRRANPKAFAHSAPGSVAMDGAGIVRARTIIAEIADLARKFGRLT